MSADLPASYFYDAGLGFLMSENYTLNFSEINLKGIGKVGGKNASLGELYNSLKPQGVNVLDGFAATAEAFRLFLRENELEDYLRSLFEDLNFSDTENLQNQARTRIFTGVIN